MKNPTIPLNNAPKAESVILLHGLARTAWSMRKAEQILIRHGYQTMNISYPSRRKDIDKLTTGIFKDIEKCSQLRTANIHFLTHSMGGILLRQIMHQYDIPKVGRAVMLSPPNQGCEIVDIMAAWPGFDLLNGPAGLQLGTGAGSIPVKQGPIPLETGIITGNKSINPLLSLLISGANDGKVSVQRAKLENMRDFLVVPHSHTFIMRQAAVIGQAMYFFQHGRFYHT